MTIESSANRSHVAANAPDTGRSRTHHFPELDALRGLAAMVVVFGHFAGLWDPSSLHRRTAFWLEVFFPFINAHASVILFFLLSGFVLSLPYQRGSPRPYRVFALRRLARIYLPYLAALMLAVVCDWYLHQPIAVSAWFGQIWTEALTWPLVLQHVLLVGNYNTAQINTAFWSLAVEMRLSLVFPLLCVPLLRFRRSFALAAVLLLYALFVAIVHLGSGRMDRISFFNLSDTVSGALAFAAGILLARWLEPIKTVWGSFPPALQLLVFASSLAMLEWSTALNSTPLRVLSFPLTLSGGGGVLMAALSFARLRHALNRPLPAWLGRISYSLYLVHGTVLFSLVHLTFGRVARIQLLAPYLTISLALAAGFYPAIEKPSIHLSRVIGSRGRL
jgi:peptidoglycan/LPS O-acetylase OafA/YrhL